MVDVYVGGPPIVGTIVEGPLFEGDLVRFKVRFRDFESWYSMDRLAPYVRAIDSLNDGDGLR